jgi:hypothetical protein
MRFVRFCCEPGGAGCATGPYVPEESARDNPLCSRSDRWFSWNFAISTRAGYLKAAIKRFKGQQLPLLPC